MCHRCRRPYRRRHEDIGEAKRSCEHVVVVLARRRVEVEPSQLADLVEGNEAPELLPACLSASRVGRRGRLGAGARAARRARNAWSMSLAPDVDDAHHRLEGRIRGAAPRTGVLSLSGLRRPKPMFTPSRATPESSRGRLGRASIPCRTAPARNRPAARSSRESPSSNRPAASRASGRGSGRRGRLRSAIAWGRVGIEDGLGSSHVGQHHLACLPLGLADSPRRAGGVQRRALARLELALQRRPGRR